MQDIQVADIKNSAVNNFFVFKRVEINNGVIYINACLFV